MATPTAHSVSYPDSTGYCVLEQSPSHENPLETSPVATFDPERPDFAPYGLSCVHWRSARMGRADHHNEIELNFLESGSITYLFGGRKVVIDAGRMAVFWAAIPHQIVDCCDSAEYYVSTIPLQWFLQWRLPDAFVQPLLKGHLLHEPTDARANADLHSFHRWECDLLQKDGNLEKAVLLEMEARMLRLASGLALVSSDTRQPVGFSDIPDSGLRNVDRMALYISQHYTDQIGVDEIAKVSGFHPNYAMKVFQRTFGTTLVDYLTRHRVTHAQRLLATTGQSVTQIAFNSGFNSISRFNEAFRRISTLTPRDYRRAHQVH